MAMSPMYGMSQPQLPYIPGGSFDPYGGMGGYGGGFGGGMGNYSMFGSYNAMPDYTGGYMQGFGQQLPSQFGYGQGGYASQFGGGMGGGFGMPQMQQPNVNDLFGQYMFGQYYGAPSFNPFQQTSMFGGGGRRGFGQQPGRMQAMQQASPFEGYELDIDALRAALGLSGSNQPASPTAQITPSGEVPRGPAAPAPTPAATPPPPMTMPQVPFDLNAFNQLTQGNLPNAPAPATPAPTPAPVAPPRPTPAAPPVQIPPNLNLFVPGFSGPEMPQATAPETGGGRFYTPPPTSPTVTVQPQPMPATPAPEISGLSYYNPPAPEVMYAPPPVQVAPPSPPPQVPMTMPQFTQASMDNLALARQAAAQNARSRGRG
jgi:hypothetical protein